MKQTKKKTYLKTDLRVRRRIVDHTSPVAGKKTSTSGREFNLQNPYHLEPFQRNSVGSENLFKVSERRLWRTAGDSCSSLCCTAVTEQIFRRNLLERLHTEFLCVYAINPTTAPGQAPITQVAQCRDTLKQPRRVLKLTCQN